MARPVRFDPREHQPTPTQRVAQATGESAEALEEALHLLRQLHEHDVLHTLSRVVAGADKLGFHALEILNEPGSVRAIRNLLELSKVLGSIDPDALASLGGALGDGLREGSRRVQERERAGIGELLGLARDPDVSLALGALVGILKGMGRSLREQDGPHAQPNTTLTGGSGH